MSTENESSAEKTTKEETAPDRSSRPAVAVTKAPKVSVDRGHYSVGGSAAKPDGKSEEHEVGQERVGAKDAGPVDVDAVLTDDSSSRDEGRPEPPA